MLEDDELARERIEDALVDGDVPFERGTAQAALRNGNFRIVYFSTFASNIGTWMQNVVLGAYALKLTGSSAFVGLVFFAQLGPLLFLSTLGGLLADVVDRRRFLVSAQLAQLGFSFALAGIALSDHPSHALIVAAVSAVGIANALGAPGLNAILPTLVPREDLSGAVALASVQMNLSRVIGPPIGALIYHTLSAAPVFAINALTYLFAVIGLLWAKYPRRTNARVAERGFARLLSGARIARRDPVLSHLLLTLFSFSFFSLAFVGLMPVIADDSFGIGPKSWQYGVLYACFGLGAALGAVSVGTVFARVSKTKLLRPSFLAFAAVLAVFALLRIATFAYPVALVLGYAYFVAITSMSTLIQSHLVDEERGRVMALWIMGFGGTVPVGVLVGGWVGHTTSITAVILAGAVWAVVLAAWSNAQSLRAKGAPDV
ncbi:MAG TPA: MFS transporter [Acidimicrobiia bacterium]|nr:MFS transporter [Acidimicrobiia bacterium]